MTREQYIANSIHAVLEGAGYPSIPVTQQNVLWMMQQIGAQADEFNSVAQHMQYQRQAYFSQAIASVLQGAGYPSIPVTQQNVLWMMQQVGAQADEFNSVAQHMQSYVPEHRPVQSSLSRYIQANKLLRYGQGPHEPEGIVNIYTDRGEIRCRFSAENFDSQTMVEVKVLDSKGRSVYFFNPVVADSDRSIDYANLYWHPKSNQIPGQYTAVAKGLCKGKAKTLVMQFNLMQNSR